MSQKPLRKTLNATTDEKEKPQTDSPVKEMKKKLAANAEKEKQAEKPDKNDKPDKSTEKSDNVADKSKGDKTEKNVDKPAEKKVDKPAEKKVDKPAEKKVDKPAEKKVDKPAEKKVDKPAEKRTEQTEKKEEAKNEKNVKPQEKPKQNGKPENGTSHNGTEDVTTVSDSEDELIIEDEMFPELTYDDTSDTDALDEGNRSYTRRSQVKPTKTPETPRPTSEKDDDSKESKILKLTEVPGSDRKLRSADSPKPEQKKDDKVDDKASKTDDKSSKTDENNSSKTDDKTSKKDGDKDKSAGLKEVQIVIEIDGEDKNESRMKTRARVSPYTRPHLHDQTSTSMLANYTGNNTTMEMDITESSVSEEPALDDSAYLRAIRTMRGRVSYRHIDVDLTQILANRARRNAALNHSAPEASRPTGTVVGRKRKPDADASIEVGREVTEAEPSGKRIRLLDTISGGFSGLRRGLHGRRQAQIVGINTDLPLSAPVATPAFDPESLKTEAASITTTPTPSPTQEKRCIVM